MINIKGLDKAEVLVRLYNKSRPLGMGMLHYTPEPMTIDEAKKFLKTGSLDPGSSIRNNSLYFDYLKGRVMKVDLSGDEFNEWLYDRDNGVGAAAAAIEPLRKQAV